MKSTIFGVLGFVVFTSSILAQVSPTPVINNEMRDGSSMRRRSMDLERFKREADQPDLQQIPKELVLKFAKIKEDFEKIQILQDEIIKVYTKGKQIDFSKISKKATEMGKCGTRLKDNFFTTTEAQNTLNTNGTETGLTEPTNAPQEHFPTTVKTLIIKLDNTLTAFVNNPIFIHPQIINSADNLKARTDLEKIIQLSTALNHEADKMSLILHVKK